MVASPTDWEAVEDAIHAWVVAATELPAASVVWSLSNAPQVARPWVWLEIISGPTPEGLHEQRTLRQRMLQTVTLPFDADEPAALIDDGDYSLRVSDADDPLDAGNLYTFEASGHTMAQVRDGLVSILAAEDDIVATAGATNTLTVEGSTARPMFHLAVEDGDMTIATNREGLAEFSYQKMRFTLRLQVEDDSETSDRVVRDYLSRAAAALGLSTVRQTLATDGRIAFRGAQRAPINLSRKVGSTFVARFAQDFEFTVAAVISADRPWARATATPTATVST
jgi:hypothetical protein